MEFLFILEQIRKQVAKYFEICPIYVHRVYPHAPSVTTPPPSSHNLLTYLLTYSTVQSPSKAANWFAASQEIPRISRNFPSL